MPLYELYCTECNKEILIKQSMHDDFPTECESCGGELKQKLNTSNVRTCTGSGIINRCNELAKDDVARIKKGDQKTRADLAGDKANKLKQ